MGLEKYRLGLYEKSMPNRLGMGEKLRAAGEAGFDYLELSIDETDEKLSRLAWDEEEIRGVWLESAGAGVPIASICLSGQRRYPMGHPDPQVRRRSMEILEGAVRLASRLSVRVIQLAGYDVYYGESTPDTRRLFSQNLRRGVEYAARYGVVLAFETMETPFLDTVQKAMEHVRRVKSPYLQVYPDLGNVTCAIQKGGFSPAGRGVLEDLKSGRGHLAAMHLKETRPGVYREVPFGKGQVDFAAGAGEAYRLGVRMFVGEFWDTGNPGWEEELTRSRRFLRREIERGIRGDRTP